MTNSPRRRSSASPNQQQLMKIRPCCDSVALLKQVSCPPLWISLPSKAPALRQTTRHVVGRSLCGAVYSHCVHDLSNAFQYILPLQRVYHGVYHLFGYDKDEIDTPRALGRKSLVCRATSHSCPCHLGGPGARQAVILRTGDSFTETQNPLDLFTLETFGQVRKHPHVHVVWGSFMKLQFGDSHPRFRQSRVSRTTCSADLRSLNSPSRRQGHLKTKDTEEYTIYEAAKRENICQGPAEMLPKYEVLR